jgi:hypothetical protein
MGVVGGDAVGWGPDDAAVRAGEHAMTAESESQTFRRYVDLAMQLFVITTIGIAGVTLLQFAGQAATGPLPQPEQFRVTVIDWAGALLIVTGMLVVVLATALRREVESKS